MNKRLRNTNVVTSYILIARYLYPRVKSTGSHKARFEKSRSPDGPNHDRVDSGPAFSASGNGSVETVTSLNRPSTASNRPSREFRSISIRRLTTREARSPVDSDRRDSSPRRAWPRQRKTDCRCAEIISWKFLMQRARARLTKSIVICCVNYGRK